MDTETGHQTVPVQAYSVSVIERWALLFNSHLGTAETASPYKRLE
jgi:hypothetical protein